MLLAQTKDQAGREVLSACAQSATEPVRGFLCCAMAEITAQDRGTQGRDQGWSRELWLKSLGLEFVLPPLG